jgi:hypothetical protein
MGKLKSALKLAVLPLREAEHQLVTKYYFTSIDFGHRHSWKPKAKFTSENGFHVHKLDFKKMIALPGGFMGHTHKLLKKKGM